MAKLNSETEIGGVGSRPRSNAGIVSGLASYQAREVGSGPHGGSCKPPAKTKKTKKIKKTDITKLSVATWNVGALKPEDSQANVCDILSRRRADTCGVQEHSW